MYMLFCRWFVWVHLVYGASDECMEDLAQQADEIQVLSSIYGDNLCCEDEYTGAFSIDIINDTLPNVCVRLLISLPSDYPSRTNPSFQLSSPHLNARQKEQLASTIDVHDHTGVPVLFQWVETLRTELPLVYATSLNDSLESQTSAQSDDTNASSSAGPSDFDYVDSQASVKCPQIYSGQSLTDRKSAFQAHCARIESMEQVGIVCEQLKSCGKVARATHNIVAWRLGPRQDCEDDGEHGAGSRLLRLLHLLPADNIIVVVSRWYGGIHLGPDRFKHINNVARDLIIANGLTSKAEQKQATQKHEKKAAKRYKR